LGVTIKTTLSITIFVLSGPEKFCDEDSFFPEICQKDIFRLVPLFVLLHEIFHAFCQKRDISQDLCRSCFLTCTEAVCTPLKMMSEWFGKENVLKEIERIENKKVRNEEDLADIFAKLMVDQLFGRK
jgi:hypothetical protein